MVSEQVANRVPIVCADDAVAVQALPLCPW
jgi:hypothetical protein